MPTSARTVETLEIVGGALCLDFANTINSRYAPEHDYLRSYQDLVAWGRHAQALTPEQAAQLATVAAQQPDAAGSAFDDALTLRDSIYQVFARLAAHEHPPAGALTAVQETYSAAIAGADLVWAETHYVGRWLDVSDPRSVLWPVAYSAGLLLLSPELARLKQCPGCGWLFLDFTKNRGRRWCSMNMCGVRDKMRRYHRRSRAATGS